MENELKRLSSDIASMAVAVAAVRALWGTEGACRAQGYCNPVLLFLGFADADIGKWARK